MPDEETPADEPIDAFADIAALELRTGRRFSGEQKPQIASLLEDATTYLRSNLGSHFTPPKTITVTLPAGYTALPAFTTEVTVVTRDDEPVSGWSFDGATVSVPGDDPADVTFVCGLAEPPAELARWTIVLVAQALNTLELGLGLTAGGLSSLQIDDFRAAFADGGADTGMAMSDRALGRLREQFGWSGVALIGMR